MRQADIQAGMVLRLKRERQADYGMDCPLVVVTGLKARAGYAVGWVQSGTAFFRPQDFAGFERWASEAERAQVITELLTAAPAGEKG